MRRFQQWFTPALVLTLLVIATPTPAQTPEPKPSFHRVLFLGNSITKHGPKEKIGWSGNWGMAASKEDKDFVHLVANALSKTGEPPLETMVRNMSGFERDYASYDLAPLLEEVIEFDSDLVILAIGENVAKPDSAEAEKTFADRTREFLQALKRDDGPVIVVRSCFWGNQTKDKILRQVCEDVGGIFVDISQLSEDKSNFARSERDFAHQGVAAHPGDKGMQAIADAILKALHGEP
ncbi:MAG: SGNH/GDSL hydrolase family protein [Verrucomicrobiales bacterium]|nr:SGNH/GDSL hydrolase family protein [Verrucomicrobiales bacterium]